MQTLTHARIRRIVVMTATLVLAVSMVVAVAAPNTTRYAFIARGDNPIDALAAAPIAGRLNSPVLLTPPTTLSDATRQGLLDRDPDVVIIAGGTAAVSDDVMAAIEQLLPDAQVLRVSGTSRYTTAQQLAALVATIDPAFATTEGNDTNAYGIACPDGHTLTAITDAGQPQCAPDQVDGGNAATISSGASWRIARRTAHRRHRSASLSARWSFSISSPAWSRVIELPDAARICALT